MSVYSQVSSPKTGGKVHVIRKKRPAEKDVVIIEMIFSLTWQCVVAMRRLVACLLQLQCLSTRIDGAAKQTCGSYAPDYSSPG
jgi:hypothetical protein